MHDLLSDILVALQGIAQTAVENDITYPVTILNIHWFIET